MLGLPELDRHPQGRHREHAAALHPGSRRGARHLSPLRHRGDPTAPVLLAIETAGANCSAAVASGEHVMAVERMALRHGHAEALLPMIERIMAAARLRPSAINRIAVAVGPGGFTGIRVGLAAAHGIGLAAGARLVGVTGFNAVAAAIAPAGGDGAVLLVALDSRRDDLYVQLFAADLASPLAAPAAVASDRLADHVARLVGSAPLLLAGDAAEAAASVLGRRRDVVVKGDTAPDALGVLAAARRQLAGQAPAEAVVPLYLRPPDVTLPQRRPGPAAVA